MPLLKELRLQAKERGFRGYSVMSKGDLELMLAGLPPAPKKLRKNQVSRGTQTDFPICQECALKKVVTHLRFKDDANCRQIAHVDDEEIDTRTGEVVGCAVDHTRWRYR